MLGEMVTMRSTRTRHQFGALRARESSNDGARVMILMRSMIAGGFDGLKRGAIPMRPGLAIAVPMTAGPRVMVSTAWPTGVIG